MDKTRYISAVNEVNEILKKDIPSQQKLIKSGMDLKQSIDEFKIKVLIIGEFSAGKTALVNKLLGSEILKEDITPETAIATELHYDKTEHVDMVPESGEAVKCSLADASMADPRKYMKYVYYLDNPVLGELSDYILVDMPGFNSGVEAHNKALLQYIGQGTAYLLVMNVEKGCITDSAIAFLNEIKNYSPYVRYILTKCDKKTEEDVEKTKVEIQRELISIEGTKPEIVTTSVQDQELPGKVLGEIKAISPAGALEHSFSDDIVHLIDRGINGLNIAKDAIRFNPAQLDMQIRRSLRAKEMVEGKFTAEKEKLQAEYQGAMTGRVINDVRVALQNNVEQLTSAAMSGQGAFEQAINGIIRPVLMKSVNVAAGEFTHQAAAAIDQIIMDSENSPEDVERISDMAKGSVDAFKNFSASQMERLQKASARKGIGTTEKALYTGITTALAVTTNVVAPIIELVIIFLPEILSFVSKSFERNRISDEIENTVIPRLCSELEPKVQEQMEALQKAVIEELESRYNDEMQGQMDILQKLKEEKAKKTGKVESQQKVLAEDIEKLEAVRKNFIVSDAE